MTEMHTILSKLDKVKAPAGFESRVLAGIDEQAGSKTGFRMILRLAMTGAAAVLVVGVILTGIQRYNARPSVVTTARSESGRVRLMTSPNSARQTNSSVIPLLETVDYSDEMRGASQGGRTVYILEQVSEGSSSGITY